MKVPNYKVPEFMLKHHAFDHLQPMWQKDMWLFLGLGVLSCVLYWLFGFLASNHRVWLSIAPALIVLLILNIRRCNSCGGRNGGTVFTLFHSWFMTLLYGLCLWVLSFCTIC